jgi:hypothetical protein
LNANEVPADSRTFVANRSDEKAADHQPFDAAKPLVPDAGATAAAPPSDTGPRKAWLPLMAALLALFASLGANVYLVWIHQGVRAKYRALLQRFQGGSLATM